MRGYALHWRHTGGSSPFLTPQASDALEPRRDPLAVSTFDFHFQRFSQFGHTRGGSGYAGSRGLRRWRDGKWKKIGLMGSVGIMQIMK